MEIEIYIDGEDWSAQTNIAKTRIEQASDGVVSTASVSVNIYGSIGASPWRNASFCCVPYRTGGWQALLRLSGIGLAAASSKSALALLLGKGSERIMRMQRSWQKKNHMTVKDNCLESSAQEKTVTSEAIAAFDRTCQYYLGISGPEFLQRYDSRYYEQAVGEDTKLSRVVAMMPFAR